MNDRVSESYLDVEGNAEYRKRIIGKTMNKELFHEIYEGANSGRPKVMSSEELKSLFGPTDSPFSLVHVGESYLDVEGNTVTIVKKLPGICRHDLYVGDNDVVYNKFGQTDKGHQYYLIVAEPLCNKPVEKPILPQIDVIQLNPCATTPEILGLDHYVKEHAELTVKLSKSKDVIAKLLEFVEELHDVEEECRIEFARLGLYNQFSKEHDALHERAKNLIKLAKDFNNDGIQSNVS